MGEKRHAIACAISASGGAPLVMARGHKVDEAFYAKHIHGHTDVEVLTELRPADTTADELAAMSTRKDEGGSSNNEAVRKNLEQAVRGCTDLVLWLDCDREGENICFEVMDVVCKKLNRRSDQQVFRARFSGMCACVCPVSCRFRVGVQVPRRSDRPTSRCGFNLSVCL